MAKPERRALVREMAFNFARVKTRRFSFDKAEFLSIIPIFILASIDHHRRSRAKKALFIANETENRTQHKSKEYLSAFSILDNFFFDILWIRTDVA